MGQATIVEFLKKEYKKDKTKWFTARKIASKIKISGISSIILSLKKLREESVPNLKFKMDFLDKTGRKIYIYQWKKQNII